MRWPQRLDLLHVAVEVGDPAQRLLRRRDVVAGAGEDDDRGSGCCAGRSWRRAPARSRPGEAVADEQVLDDPADLVAVHQEEAAPPALELEEALGLRVDVRAEVVVLAEPGVAGLQALEVRSPGWRRRRSRCRGRPAASMARTAERGRRGSASGSRPRSPAQYDRGAPFSTRAPAESGSDAASIITAQPPWQLPMTTGLGASGWSRRTSRQEGGLGRGDVERRSGRARGRG